MDLPNRVVCVNGWFCAQNSLFDDDTCPWIFLSSIFELHNGVKAESIGLKTRGRQKSNGGCSSTLFSIYGTYSFLFFFFFFFISLTFTIFFWVRKQKIKIKTHF